MSEAYTYLISTNDLGEVIAFELQTETGLEPVPGFLVSQLFAESNIGRNLMEYEVRTSISPDELLRRKRSKLGKSISNEKTNLNGTGDDVGYMN